VLSVVAGERVRVAYQLCQAIQADLKTSDIKFQTGQLIQLSLAAKALIEQLGSCRRAEVMGCLQHDFAIGVSVMSKVRQATGHARFTVAQR